MVDYHFKDWLTIEEAAAWLTNNTGTSYSAAAVDRVIKKGFLWPYYYPERGQLGLFRRRINLEDETVKPAGRPLQFIGPLALYDYAGFTETAARSPTALIGSILGRSEVPPPVEDEYAYFDDAAYLVGENDEPISLTSQPYKILIRAADLEDFAAGFPNPEPLPRPIYRTVPGVWAACFDIYADEAMTPGIDHPPLEQPTKEQSQEAKNDTPALKALAFAAHLIADLADQLDAHMHGDKQSSKRLGLKFRNGKPIVSKIAKQLEKTATDLKHTGHGFKKSGFQETLSKALNELGLD